MVFDRLIGLVIKSKITGLQLFFTNFSFVIFLVTVELHFIQECRIIVQNREFDSVSSSKPFKLKLLFLLVYSFFYKQYFAICD